MSDQKTQTTEKLPFEKTWYLAQTLLGCGPDSDVNRRSIHHGTKEICTLNHRMDEWNEEDSQALQSLCDYLNRKELECLTSEH